MKKEHLFEECCDAASKYLDNINYNDNKGYILSLPLFRKENNKIFICFYIEKQQGTYASKPLDWLLIDIDSCNVYKFYNCHDNDYDTNKILPNTMNILVSPFFYLQLVYYDITYIKYLYEQSVKYIYNVIFSLEYGEIDKIKMLNQDGRTIEYTNYIKQNLKNYTLNKQGIETFMGDFNSLVSKSLLAAFEDIISNIKENKDYQTSLTEYLNIVKFVCNQDAEIIDAIDNVADKQNKELTNALKNINNIIIPKRKNDRLIKFGNNFFENNIK